MIAGDGIGQEVIPEGRVLKALDEAHGLGLTFEHFDLGDATSEMAPPDELVERFLTEFDAIFLGALGDPREVERPRRDILLGLRFKLDLFINLRPVQLSTPATGLATSSPRTST